MKTDKDMKEVEVTCYNCGNVFTANWRGYGIYRKCEACGKDNWLKNVKIYKDKNKCKGNVPHQSSEYVHEMLMARIIKKKSTF